MVHAGDDSVSPKSPDRPDTEKLEEAINTLPRELLGLRPSSSLKREHAFFKLLCIKSLRTLQYTESSSAWTS